MDIVNKTILQKRLFGQRIKKQIIENVRAMVAEFQHYKRVDKRFIDAFENRYPECHAFMIKNNYHDEIVFRWNEHNENFNDRPEVRIVKHHGFNQQPTPITWQDIINELERYKIDESIQACEYMIERYDHEYNLVTIFKSQFNLLKSKLSNFYGPIGEINRILDNIIEFGK